MLALPASHLLGDQLFKLLPEDGAAHDWFGRTVSIYGNTVIVGVALDDDNGADSGSAYLFDTTTGTQLFKLLPDDGVANDGFGVSVALSLTTAVVGASHDDDNGDGSGSVYVYDVATGTQIAKLLPDDGEPEDSFGVSVGISGATVIVGSHNDDDNGFFSGSAYLFDISDPANPIQVAKLLSDDGAVNDNFGSRVAICGAAAIISAVHDNDNGVRSGSAYLFDTTTGIQLAKLLPDDGAAGDAFGSSVAISGVTSIVGAFWDDDNGNCSGSAYLFDTQTGDQIAKLLPDDGAPDDNFGFAVAISNDTAIVGAIHDDDNGNVSGSAYLFSTTTPGQQTAKLLPDDGSTGDEFGYSVAISEVIAVAGAIFDDDLGTDSGSAYLFSTEASCPADLDCDGDADAKDFFAYLDLFAAADDRADIDDDGDIDADDFFRYLDLFSTGCD